MCLAERGIALIEQKERFYENELEDDFANNSRIDSIKIDSNYKYIHKSFLWNIIAFIIYRIIAPIPALIYEKVNFHLKIEGRDIIKKYTKTNKNRIFYLSESHTRNIRCYFAYFYCFSGKSIYYC